MLALGEGEADRRLRRMRRPGGAAAERRHRPGVVLLADDSIEARCRIGELAWREHPAGVALVADPADVADARLLAHREEERVDPAVGGEELGRPHAPGRRIPVPVPPRRRPGRRGVELARHDEALDLGEAGAVLQEAGQERAHLRKVGVGMSEAGLPPAEQAAQLAIGGRLPEVGARDQRGADAIEIGAPLLVDRPPLGHREEPHEALVGLAVGALRAMRSVGAGVVAAGRRSEQEGVGVGVRVGLDAPDR